MLKNRQSSKAPINLKRPAPSNPSAESETINHLPEQALPHRSSTLSTQVMSQPAVSDSSSRRQTSLDNTQTMSSNRLTENAPQSTWMASTPELLTETMSSPEPMSATSANPSLANQEPSSLAWSQQFNNPNKLPDLMPIMFPSDDPFAYPTQPMSTLEDDHFRHDHTGMQFPFESAPQPTGMAPSTHSDPSGAGVSTPSFDAFANLPGLPVGAPSGVKSSVPSRLQVNAQSMNSSRLHSPISQGQTPSETLSSPDLVSIPNQNFVWQGYNFQPTNMDTDTIMQQDTSVHNGLSDLNMGPDENTMGMNMDLGISFDDLFGNTATSRPGNRATNDDWNQWMNAGV